MFSMGAILSAAPESQQCRKQEQLIERSAAKGHPVKDAEDFLSALVAALNTLERPSAIDLRMCCFTPAIVGLLAIVLFGFRLAQKAAGTPLNFRASLGHYTG
jgi:hypothetical protein